MPFVVVLSLADLFEGLVPLLIYRSLKTKPLLSLKRPKITYTINAALASVLVISALSLTYSYRTVFLATFALSIVLVLFQAAVEDHKTWLTWLPIGVLLASTVSGLFGVGALVGFGMVPAEAFTTVFVGWVFGDIIVLATLGTILTVMLTPWIIKSKIYVKRFFA